MKSKLLFLLLLLGSSYITAQTVIENPPFETRQGSIHTISKIELSPTETRLTIRTVFRPQWWTSLDSLTYIYAPESKKQLYPLRIEGRKFGEQVTTPASGIIEDDCVITYPPLPEGTTRIDWIDDNLNSETNTYGILLVKRVHKFNAVDKGGEVVATDAADIIQRHCFQEVIIVRGFLYFQYRVGRIFTGIHVSHQDKLQEPGAVIYHHIVLQHLHRFGL